MKQYICSIDIITQNRSLLKHKFLFLFIFTYTIATNAQLIRSYSNEFLNIGVGARAMGMSKAVSSFTNGVESGYWNPAGAVSVTNYEFSAMHNSLFNGIGSYDYMGAAMPLESKNLAVVASVIRLGVDNILNTTNLIDSNGNINFNNIKQFSSADIAALFSVAKKFPKINLNVGVNAKIIRRNIGDFATGNGFGFDIGAQYQLGNIKLGVVIRDVTTTFTAWSIDNAIFASIANAPILDENGIVVTDNETNQEKPEKYEVTLPKFQLGASYFKQFNEKYSLLTSLDLIGRFIETNDIISSNFVSFSPNLGFELGYKNTAFFRAGFGNIQKETDFNKVENGIDEAFFKETQSTSFEPSIGVGIKFKKIYIDYALTNVGAGSGVNYSNVFSLKVQL